MPEGKMDGQCTYCRWKSACGQAILDSVPGTEEGDIDDEIMEYMNAVVSEYREAKEAEEKAVYAKKKAQESLKELLMDADVRRAKVPGKWSVSWSKVKGRKSFDRKAAEEDGLDLTPYMKEGAGFDRLMVNFSKGKT
jgi:hypothetical protein